MAILRVVIPFDDFIEKYMFQVCEKCFKRFASLIILTLFR